MIYINNLEVMRGNNTLLNNACATIYPHKRVGLIGRNGCGKSTLFALIKKEILPENGDINIPSSWVISSVAQETPGLEESALDYVIDGDKQYRALEKELKAAEEANDGMKAASLHMELENIQAYTINSRAGRLLLGLGFSTADFTKPTKEFSGGWRMRLNLAQALICRSDLLLLDEPTNHLDLDTVMWLEDWLKAYPGTLIIISHDRDFLDNICTNIIHIEHKKLNCYTGNYTDFEVERAQRLALEKAMYDKQQTELAHMQAFVDKFRYKATKAKQAQSRLKAMERMEKIVLAQADSPFSFSFFENENVLPPNLIRMDNLTAGYPDKTVLTSIKMNIVPGSRIGLLGRNGAGKSTLIKTIAGEIPPLSGEFALAKAVKVGYFAQHQLEYLDPEGTPLSHLTALAPDARELELRSFLGGFGFSGDKVTDPVGHFSGGEKARLVLALLVWQKPNLLLLDEPTNHLDLQMREAIIIALSSFKGALIVVSHDRHLLRTTTDEFYSVSEGKVFPFDGDLDDYHEYLMELDKKEQEKLNAEKADERAHKPVQTNDNFKNKDQKRAEAAFRKTLSPLKKKIEKLEHSLDELNARKNELETILADASIYEAARKNELQAYLLEQSSVSEKLEEVETEWMLKSEELQDKITAFENEQA
ncbi:MAG: ATP-binding cassette domain-containing protein [Succinivibrionaceae bacterium]|nr:ATP-binding cassette domain-containing protein [Succinivibrionaceae bacterium]